MFTRQRSILFRTALIVAICVPLGLLGGYASAEPIPRLLLAGDSWTGFMLAFRSFREVLPEYAGLERWIEVGNRTAEMGARAFEMLERNYLDILEEELTRYPNIDVVVITLGGNDILRGTKGVDPNNYDRTVSIRHCFQNPSGPPWSSATECMDWLAISVRDQVSIIVDHILNIRPDIRVAILSYDYAAREPSDFDGQGNPLYTVGDQHEAFVAVQERMRELALVRERVEFVMNFGLMQHLYGIPSYADQGFPTPRDGFPNETILPGVAPYPCDAPEDPECVYWPGGFPQYLSPLMTYIDQDIHLTDFGYADVTRRVMDKHIETWLNYPKVLQILPLDNKSIYQFRVTFSHPVVGVAVDDFEIFVEDKSGFKSMAVIGVEPAAGPADVYTVTVDMAGSEHAAFIRVLDDDSISRPDTGMPLGGPGVGNGFFEYNGLYEFEDFPEPDAGDFEGAMKFLYMASQAYEHLLMEFGVSFNPDYFDVNGPGEYLDLNSDPPVIPGNAIPDLFELMLIGHVLSNPGFDLSAQGGVTYDVVKDAWDTNFEILQTALGGPEGLAAIILPGLDTLLAGLTTIGDVNSNAIVLALGIALAAVDEIPTNIHLPTLMSPFKVHLPHWFALHGDADGDGWTNEQEFAYFGPDGLDAYVAAALNPDIQPTTGAGRYRVNDFVRIAMMDTPKWNTEYQWYRDGVPLVDDGRIVGATSRTLDILSTESGDSGAYTCVYTGLDKSIAVYGPIQVRVVDDSEMPVSGMAGLVALLFATGLAGAAALRKRK